MPTMPPIHPGEILLEEFLEPLSISQYRLAKDISVPPRRINEIVHGKRAISANTALRLARYFGTTDQFWLNLQTRYNLELEKDRLGERLEGRGARFRASGVDRCLTGAIFPFLHGRIKNEQTKSVHRLSQRGCTRQVAFKLRWDRGRPCMSEIFLEEGQSPILYSEDLEVDGVVRYSKKENLWVAVIDWDAIREVAPVVSRTEHHSPA